MINEDEYTSRNLDVEAEVMSLKSRKTSREVYEETVRVTFLNEQDKISTVNKYTIFERLPCEPINAIYSKVSSCNCSKNGQCECLDTLMDSVWSRYLQDKEQKEKNN